MMEVDYAGLSEEVKALCNTSLAKSRSHSQLSLFKILFFCDDTSTQKLVRLEAVFHFKSKLGFFFDWNIETPLKSELLSWPGALGSPIASTWFLIFLLVTNESYPVTQALQVAFDSWTVVDDEVNRIYWTIQILCVLVQILLSAYYLLRLVISLLLVQTHSCMFGKFTLQCRQRQHLSQFILAESPRMLDLGKRFTRWSICEWSQILGNNC